MPLNVEDQLFAAEQIGAVALIRLKGNLIRRFTDLNLKEGLFKYLHEVRNDGSVKVVLFIGNPEKIKRREMVRFLCELSDSGANINRIARVYNAINQLILFVRSLKKLVVFADSGEILSLFFNISLACDYRIVGDRTVFQYPTLELGLVPKGGGIYFLSRSIGVGKTMEILLSGRDVSAEQALALGMVDRIVPSDALAEEALRIAGEIAEKPMSLISGIKRLVNEVPGELSAFLETENDVLMECIKSTEFQRRVFAACETDATC